MNALIVIQLVSTFFMTGVIWVIQLVHYPAYRWIEPTDFIGYQNFHQKWISVIVIPAMLTELIAAAGLYLLYPTVGLFLANLVTVLFAWAFTFLLNVPLHQKLEKGKDLKAIEAQILRNWPRTIIWTLRSVALGIVLNSHLQF